MLSTVFHKAISLFENSINIVGLITDVNRLKWYKFVTFLLQFGIVAVVEFLDLPLAIFEHLSSEIHYSFL